jgi:nucleoid-associated protein YgaU
MTVLEPELDSKPALETQAEDHPEHQAPVVVEVTSPQEPEVIEVPKPVIEPKPERYTVQKGDTLWSIATRFYGNGQRWLDIARTNRIYRSDRVSEGAVLQLP